jgi:hypothetical protein
MKEVPGFEITKGKAAETEIINFPKKGSPPKNLNASAALTELGSPRDIDKTVELRDFDIHRWSFCARLYSCLQITAFGAIACHSTLQVFRRV